MKSLVELGEEPEASCDQALEVAGALQMRETILYKKQLRVTNFTF